MERRRLTGEELTSAVGGLDGWNAADDRITRVYKFSNFAQALTFINRVGELAEAADHHPDITFGWGYARIDLTTHDRGGVTDVDIALARRIDGLL